MPTSSAIPLWGRFETSFLATTAASPDTEITVDLTGPDRRRRKVRAFWFGSREWRVRFQPDAVGTWKFQTRSSPRVAGLDGQTGVFACAAPTAPKTIFEAHGPVRVKPRARHLSHADGTAFFWLGDTAWNGPMMSRNAADWDLFLANRSAKHFNAIQFVMTHWRAGATNSEHETTFSGRDPIWINPHWFEKMDERFDAMERAGFLAVPVLIWTLGKDEINPSRLPEREIIKLCRYMVARFGAHHVAWILNGDGRYYGADAAKWKRIGRAVFDLGHHAPVMQHPGGMQWPHDAFENEKWIDLIGYQTGHGDDAETLQWIHSGPPARKWRGSPRPFLNVEPPYEDHISYQSRRRHNAFTVRRACWWSVLNAPPAGLTYGAHGVWGWEEKAQPPADHFYTGVAQPWHIAMQLEGSTHMRHLADFFRSLPWWKLSPDDSLVKSAPPPPKPGRIRLVYSRNIDGETAIWINGVKRAGGFISGDFSTWVPDTFLTLGNESTGDFGWRGTFHGLALYDRLLTPAEIARQPAPGALAAYDFRERRGAIMHDRANRGSPLPLRILTPEKVRWQKDGLRVDGDAEIKSTATIARLLPAWLASQSLSIALEFTPSEWNHRACGRLLSIEVDRWNRNVTLAQVATDFTAHIRTSVTSGNAEPGLATGETPTAFTHLSAARTPAGDCAVFYLPMGGTFQVAPRKLAHGLRPTWFNPRTGRRTPARALARGLFQSPTGEDWVLLLNAG